MGIERTHRKTDSKTDRKLETGSFFPVVSMDFSFYPPNEDLEGQSVLVALTPLTYSIGIVAPRTDRISDNNGNNSSKVFLIDPVTRTDELTENMTQLFKISIHNDFKTACQDARSKIEFWLFKHKQLSENKEVKTRFVHFPKEQSYHPAITGGSNGHLSLPDNGVSTIKDIFKIGWLNQKGLRLPISEIIKNG